MTKKKEQERNSNIAKSDFFKNYIVSIPHYINEERIKTCYMLWKGKSNFYDNLLKILNYLNKKGSTTSHELEEKIFEWILDAKPNAKKDSRFPKDIINYLITYNFIEREKNRISNTQISEEVLRNPSGKTILSILLNKIVGFEFFYEYEYREHSKKEMFKIWSFKYKLAYTNNDTYSIDNDDYLLKQFNRRVQWLISLKYITKTKKIYFIKHKNWPHLKKTESYIPIEKEIDNFYGKINTDRETTEKNLATDEQETKPVYITTLLEAYLVYNSFKNIQPGLMNLSSLSDLFRYLLTKYTIRDKFTAADIAETYKEILKRNFKRPWTIAYGMLEFIDKIFLISKINGNYAINKKNKTIIEFSKLILSEEHSKFYNLFQDYISEEIKHVKFFQILFKFFKNNHVTTKDFIVRKLGSEMLYWSSKILTYNSYLSNPKKNFINTQAGKTSAKKPFNLVVIKIGLDILKELEIIKIEKNKYMLVKKDFIIFKQQNNYIDILDDSIIPNHFFAIFFDLIERNKKAPIFYFLEDTPFLLEFSNLKGVFGYNENDVISLNWVDFISNARDIIELLNNPNIFDVNYRNFILTQNQIILFNFKKNSLKGIYIPDVKLIDDLAQLVFKIEGVHKKITEKKLSKIISDISNNNIFNNRILNNNIDKTEESKTTKKTNNISNNSILKETSERNILGYQVPFFLIKSLYNVIKNAEEGINEEHLYKKFYFEPPRKNNLRTKHIIFQNCINFLKQTNFINIEKNLISANPFAFSNLSFEINFFNAIKKLTGIAKSPYFAYEKLVREDIDLSTFSNQDFLDFSNELPNKYNEIETKNYKITKNQVSAWFTLMNDLGAITVSKVRMLYPKEKFLKEILEDFAQNEKRIFIPDFIDFHENNFYPVKKSSHDNLSPWFKNFLKHLNDTHQIELIMETDRPKFIILDNIRWTHLIIKSIKM